MINEWSECMAVSRRKGERAMKYIADAPLYASTCGITYDDAVKVAKALNREWEAELVEMERFNNLSSAEQIAEIKAMQAVKAI